MTNPGPTVIGGRYELGELLGRGGMAEVRKGTDLRLGRAVAVKRLRTDLASDATFQARFRREAQASASLNHPAIVAVYDTGEEMSSDGTHVAQPYIVMEFVAGRTLRDILREGRKILPERALEITSGVLSALDYSHRAGIIHRDIKPGNVMLTPTGDVKVMDFGIARAVSDASSAMTQTAAVVGTAQYLSPEQARGETVDSRSDVYSTGCLLYELLTGRPPFVGDSPVSVAYQHVREPANPPSDHDTELPPELDAIVMKALAKRVEERYQSAADMRTDIERYLAGRPVQAPPVPPAAATAVVPPVVPPAAAADTAVAAAAAAADEEEGGSRVGWWIAAGVALVALIAGAAFLLPMLFDDSPTDVRVPSLVGMSESAARTAIGEAELTVGEVTYEDSSEVGRDKVISQDPDRDSYVAPGTKVDLVVSSGKPQVRVESVIGLTKGEARRILQEQNLAVVLQETEDDAPAGQVVKTDPSPGTLVPEGSTVTVYYSDGPETVPNVVGKQEDVARTILTNAGFTVKVFTSSEPTDKPVGTVLEQTPEAGTTQPAGTQIVLIVTTYVAPTESPSPTESPTTSPSPSPSPSPSQ
ncbi:MAG TPA: Stk1 family PASTA domain-containing Ser/Thr kinase [Nocardioides sp.]|uniref:Stk1 family PASTA domain-containing Ser/Thr kinase n=1 Tax=Nocardioides sp. TaxID=35761 RepID=UPI002BBE2B21|nr:Stk1 family PASTA domain-containing Ser/Thr kinase [Nocardioides sp.]HQR26802.1 Stk1 family PASTA domain-containing Ser/Thr kinase [Nocardioides sp.]